MLAQTHLSLGLVFDLGVSNRRLSERCQAWDRHRHIPRRELSPGSSTPPYRGGPHSWWIGLCSFNGSIGRRHSRTLAWCRMSKFTLQVFMINHLLVIILNLGYRFLLGPFGWTCHKTMLVARLKNSCTGPLSCKLRTREPLPRVSSCMLWGLEFLCPWYGNL